MVNPCMYVVRHNNIVYGRMSLTSASGIISGIKEYGYRGIQQFPIVLTATSLLFTITTGSVAHANLAAGLAVLMPLYTIILQISLGYILKSFAPSYSLWWTRSTSDSCNIIPNVNVAKGFKAYDPASVGDAASVPSFWLMEVAFFIGYAMSNAVDSLMAPTTRNADPESQEKRTHGAINVISVLGTVSILLLLTRLITMTGCEGRGTLGIFLSILCAGGAGWIGYIMYTVSRACGSRASDLFGLLSQMLPASATSPSPIVCTAD